MAKRLAFNYQNEKGDVTLTPSFPEGPEVTRQLEDFVALLDQAREEIQGEILTRKGEGK